MYAAINTTNQKAQYLDTLAIFAIALLDFML